MTHFNHARITRPPRPYVPPAPVMALRFPSNTTGDDQSNTIAALTFDRPDLDGFGLWGNGNSGVTIFRRIRPRSTVGWVAQFFYSDDSSAEESFGSNRGYIGWHPYPDGSSHGERVVATSHRWEISIDQGDYVNNGSGQPIPVVVGEWVVQACRWRRNGASDKEVDFFVNLPSTDPDDIIHADITTSGYGEATPPCEHPVLILGDNTWYTTYQHERGACDHAELLIVMDYMTDEEIAAQAADLQTLTAASQAAVWMWNKSWNLADLSCDAGTGRSWTLNDPEDALTVVEVT